MNENEVKAKIKEMLCDRLGIEAEALENDTPLFNDGIGLDSIDSLEIISAIDEEYGVSMTGVGKEHFRDVNALAAYVVAHAE
ncbi:MAG: phosphopantetheine-binding protein [Candidatus Borkfalkiaceae bacterium]|nr:phosphopantetheine-binding protein [Christensenellaceae bacterium]